MADLHAWQAHTQQATFRQLLEAFSYPGRVVEIEHGLLQLVATLVDSSVTLADPDALLSADDRRRLGAFESAPEQATFVLINGCEVPGFTPALGTLESPEHGATFIVQVESLTTGAAVVLSGPGIKGTQRLSVTGLDPTWWQLRSQWNRAFPTGVELILVAGNRVASIPRTTRAQGTV